MKKREFLVKGSQYAALGGAAALGLGSSSQVLAQSAPNGYEIIDPPIATRSTDSVEVLEFFWFGCPHCFAFEPSINKWKDGKPDYVSFVREAPPLNPSWEGHSRAFYAAEALGVTDQFFDPMFDNIHKKRRNLRAPKDIAKFAGELGINEEEFTKAMTSFTVDVAIRRSMKLAQTARVSGVPSIIINGKYRTGNSIAGSHANIINVINSLSAKEKEAMKI